MINLSAQSRGELEAELGQLRLHHEKVQAQYHAMGIELEKQGRDIYSLENLLGFESIKSANAGRLGGMEVTDMATESPRYRDPRAPQNIGGHTRRY